MTAPKIYRFNTGRLYSAAGQRITVAVYPDGTVDMNDHDRMIDGRIEATLPDWKQDSLAQVAKWVIANYDRSYIVDMPRDARAAVALDRDASFAPVDVAIRAI